MSEAACMHEAASEMFFMRRALALASRSCGHTRPNPPVGAVVVKEGRIIGEGRHVRCGADHAETAALKSVKVRGGAKDATVYVTLEPCSREGRVGACCDALIAAGVGRVVWAIPDPNPKNAGRAMKVLRRAGVASECWIRSRDADRQDCVREAERLIAPFAKHVRTGLPFVTVKLAMSLDGKICDDFGDARWVSSERARKRTGRLRERVDAIMVGAETVRRDNPSLLSHGRRNDDLYRVVVTSSGRLPQTAQIFTDDAKDRTLVFRPGGRGIRGVMDDLGARGIMHVLCEGGLKLARSLAAEGLVDEWIAVISPKVIGDGRIVEAKVLPSVSVLCDFKNGECIPPEK
ncbi:MAG: bifunctional diaminohydroxyphosphoribosylaminopyrimidine deaminase/5-amino-6-(5-phosphoribosylamino)uracil reductase RibD [Lentisphaerae bacterium]|nr:bifunctional diaminohydroxyphosphoribosylaminopyrimidine deaminase/5-amino-6-(5-phosphoribosylamino)uracil reductase RibD [Lentisphaerota bacterium]